MGSVISFFFSLPSSFFFVMYHYFNSPSYSWSNSDSLSLLRSSVRLREPWLLQRRTFFFPWCSAHPPLQYLGVIVCGLKQALSFLLPVAFHCDAFFRPAKSNFFTFILLAVLSFPAWTLLLHCSFFLLHPWGPFKSYPLYFFIIPPFIDIALL